QAISARKVRPPGDVWSIGVMLYELLSGVHPFSGETPNAIMANAIKEPLPPLAEQASHVPAPLARFIERSLEKNPDDRPADAGGMRDGLREGLAEITLGYSVPEAPVAPPKWDGSEDAGSGDGDIQVGLPSRAPPVESLTLEVAAAPSEVLASERIARGGPRRL